MAVYLTERYWPGVDAVRTAEATAQLIAAGIQVETTLAPVDEVCCWKVEADSADALAAAFAAAAVLPHRTTAATTLPPGTAMSSTIR